MIARLLIVALCLLATPALAQNPLASPSPSPLQPGDAFGEEVSLPAKTIIFLRGKGKWENAHATLVEAFDSLRAYTDKQNIKPSGPALTVFNQPNDSGFAYLAAFPIEKPPADPPKGDIAIGDVPAGRALKFTHRGSYDAMDTTYEAITNFLDQKNLDAKDTFIEEYAGGPLKAGDESLLVHIYVPVK